MKQPLFYLYTSLLLLLATACNRGQDEAAEGRAYQLSGSFEVDSTVVLDHLVLYADNHASLRSDTLLLSSEKGISHEGHTAGFDELYLCSDGGELCRMYASGGMEVSFKVRSEADSLVVTFAPSEHDSINPWLQEQLGLFKSRTPKESCTLLDSLCHQHPADLRNTLLLRELTPVLEDSVFVRRCLGALSDEAKPDWLVKSIDFVLSVHAPYLKQSRRMSDFVLEIDDTTHFDLSASRSDYLLLYCWADYDQASIDSLAVVENLVKEEFDMKRLMLITCCLSAPDSAWWRGKTEGLEGHHAFLPAGLSDKRVRSWRIERVPAIFVCDMYGNVQKHDVWGQPLREALNRVPNRSGFAHTPKTKPHGR